MVFAGEASWRWRMLLPATDRVYDTFWKQALRWLALPAGDPIQVSVEPGAAPGDTLPVRVVARNAAFEPLKNVTVDVRVTSPDGRVESLRAGPDTAPRATTGTTSRTYARSTPACSSSRWTCGRARHVVGTASASVLVGGADLEMTDPRVNQAFLERLAAAVRRPRAGRGSSCRAWPSMLKAGVPAAALAVRRDLWHTGWSFAAILMLLGAEWMLRRTWGLR